MGLLERLKRSLENRSEVNSGEAEKGLKIRQEEVKGQLLRSIDKWLVPYKSGQGVLQNRNQCGAEKDVIERQINIYKKELQEMFSDKELFLLRYKLHQKADLRCEFREKRGHLPLKKLEKLLQLERQTSSDKGRQFIKICQRLGLIEIRKPLKTYENIAQRESGSNNVKGYQGRSAGTLGKGVVKEKGNVPSR
ncbi:MAG: hypothetical protein PHX01_05440 [Clostridia bacterium]|nr:hypothetical protein [Clostridia bacterium]